MAEFATLLTEVKDKVATIWLNRPERRNAFDLTMSQEMHDALAMFEADDDVRVIVLTGSGKFFSVGADLDPNAGVFAGSFDENGRYKRALHLLTAGMRTPLIAAMNGTGVGAGLSIPLCCDIRYAAADAKYGLIFTQRGLVPDVAMTWLLPRIIGVSRAMDLILSGRSISGTEAAEMGLVSQALPADEVLAAAQSFARYIAVNTPAIAVGAAKALINAGLEDPNRAAAGDREGRVFLWLARQPDVQEGVKAFFEKRPPEWPTPKSAIPPIA